MRIYEAATLDAQAYADLVRPPEAEARRREVDATVHDIVATVLRDGDQAVVDYTNRFDGTEITVGELEVTPAERSAAYAQVAPEAVDALRTAHARIMRFHREGLRLDWNVEPESGLQLGQIVRAIDRVGVYCPGGRAAYPSTVLMTVTPARVAGCSNVVMMSPPTGGAGTIAPAVLVAADIAGVDRIFKTGGAQAIAALAYGTDHIPAVEKIVGPGNVYVQAAKRLVAGRVAIDMEAGPSEVLVIADETANPQYVAADLLAQAEHEPDAVAICVTTSQEIAHAVAAAVDAQFGALQRQDIIRQALERNSFILVTESMQDAVAYVNARAPEHLELQVAEPESLLKDIRNAGSIFLGAYSPNAVGDYLAGPNHVLPTAGQAKFASPLHTEDFRTVSSVIEYSAERLAADAPVIQLLAELEGFGAHAASVRIRQEQ